MAQKDDKVQYGLALMAEEGKGLRQDYKAAVDLYRPAAEHGFAPAQYKLGCMYTDGKGVEKDLTQAAKWFRLAADHGYAAAEVNLGLMYIKGDGITRDYKQALKLFRRASSAAPGKAVYDPISQGLQPASADAVALGQNHLATMVFNGMDMTPNKIAGYAIYNISLTNDSSRANPAAINRKALDAYMGPNDAKAAENLTKKMSQPGNLLPALDQYIAQHPIR
ncbi:MAG TPA: tetratricopeptide repeat protein [Burkholderiaceae bacterium]